MIGKKILLGVSGGIAAYKACTIASRLVQAGAEVRVIMTGGALKFLTPQAFLALTGKPVHTDTFEEPDPSQIAHIELADWADLVLVAPATANTIGKLANGIADDMLSTTLLATKAPIFIAPAMNDNMYANSAVQRNMRVLADMGMQLLEPGAGYLACGHVGKGRLAEPEEIVEDLRVYLSREKDFAGLKVLISAGPTREVIDPVRFFTNHSTGKMGFALAEAAAERGASVTLVAGPVSLTANHPNITRVDVTTAEEMYEAIHSHFKQSDLVIKSAAVADYRPKIRSNEKMKKQPGNLTIEMERTRDILKSLGEAKQNQFLVGFAAETSNALAYGREKLQKKNLDAIVINNVAEPGAGFGHDTNIATFISKELGEKNLPLSSKKMMAHDILNLIKRELPGDTK
ncbi:bifunctional phosphopantothenoylcysteine decarboxylase/phosphopantothenate--cysteine ligase CoaBC [Aciduricibacillus chroicocephali]|uniref:Coenzyme A biosynthesis bifunctional protein CoaBC n=1 Tax=Aciduricibacillus chroicocephali TaxID=3054939 RepID=A0ABY9L1N8_9BACI|nr:bifunctional phosphopantothenoylcysteine decarboxylase/phosphopantothenate--cysteine ligase CoaBC [Bacillaceae bacterium 44XB]